MSRFGVAIACVLLAACGGADGGEAVDRVNQAESEGDPDAVCAAAPAERECREVPGCFWFGGDDAGHGAGCYADLNMGGLGGSGDPGVGGRRPAEARHGDARLWRVRLRTEHLRALR